MKRIIVEPKSGVRLLVVQEKCPNLVLAFSTFFYYDKLTVLYTNEETLWTITKPNVIDAFLSTTGTPNRINTQFIIYNSVAGSTYYKHESLESILKGYDFVHPDIFYWYLIS
jgi:hypothetical protein